MNKSYHPLCLQLQILINRIDRQIFRLGKDGLDAVLAQLAGNVPLHVRHFIGNRGFYEFFVGVDRLLGQFLQFVVLEEDHHQYVALVEALQHRQGAAHGKFAFKVGVEQ